MFCEKAEWPVSISQAVEIPKLQIGKGKEKWNPGTGSFKGLLSRNGHGHPPELSILV